MSDRSVLDGHRNGSGRSLDDRCMPCARRDDVIARPVDGSLLIVDPVEQQLHWLNEIAALVWGLCDGHTSYATARARLHDRVGALSADAIVDLTILRLQHRHLLLGLDGLASPEPSPTRPKPRSTHPCLWPREARTGRSGLPRWEPLCTPRASGRVVRWTSRAVWRNPRAVRAPVSDCGAANRHLRLMRLRRDRRPWPGSQGDLSRSSGPQPSRSDADLSRRRYALR